MSKQRTRKFVTKILRKTCSSLVKINSDGENHFTQNKYNKLQKITAKNKCFFAQNKCKSSNMQIIFSSITCFRPDRYANSKFIIQIYFYIILNACGYIASVETL